MIKTTWKRVSHRPRGQIIHDVLHVSMELCRGLPSMRTPRARSVIVQAIANQRGRFEFRIVEFAIIDNHMHLIVEAASPRELGRAMKGLAVRMARGLNKLWGRTGRVFADRYWSRVVRKVGELRRLVRYVLQNARRHGIRVPDDWPDVYSSGLWFRHWQGHHGRTFSKEPPPTQPASRMELECAQRFAIELTERPTPAPPLKDPRKRRRLYRLKPTA